MTGADGVSRFIVYVQTKRFDWATDSRTTVVPAGYGTENHVAIAYAETWQQAVDSVIGGLRRSEKIIELRVARVEDIPEVPGETAQERP